MRSKYQLLPTDPRWLALDPETVEALYYAHQYAEHGVPNEVVDEDFDSKLAALDEQLEDNAAPKAGPDDDFEEVIDDRRN